MNRFWKFQSRTFLQIAVAIAGIVPVSAGFYGIVIGTSMITGAAADPALESHYRYLSGLLFGIGLGFWSCIPNIEHQSPRVRILAFLVVIGGLGRLGYALYTGLFTPVVIFTLMMELVVTPLLALWQHKLRQKITLH